MPEWLTKRLVTLPALLASLPAQAQVTTDRPGYWHSAWEEGWGHMMFGSLMMILLWGGIILVIILAVRWFSRSPGSGDTSPPSRKAPLQILEERFARGEIDKEEFEQRKQLLTD